MAVNKEIEDEEYEKYILFFSFMASELCDVRQPSCAF